MTDKKRHVHKNWNALYALVIGVLVLLMVLFYFFTKYFE
jgi:hypothetical protein